MSALHQMGNDTFNIVLELELRSYRGVIASPVNNTPSEVQDHIARRKTATFPFVLDPQLYYPRSERGQLPQWSYFPEDIDSSELASEEWWVGVSGKILDAAESIEAPIACSPARCAGSYPNSYYSLTTAVASAMAAENRRGVKVWQTVLAPMSDLTQPNRAYEIASVVTRTKASGIYLLFLSDLQPRNEFTDTDELKGAMILIREMAKAGLPVTVGCCGSEAILWSAAGAANCATGKFFNLRRFTKGRFDEPSEGGRQVAYWFEEALLASLRDSDLVRVCERDLLSETSQDNPFANEILEVRKSSPGTSWIGLGWRQYMHWFADILDRIDDGLDIDALMANAETNWDALKNPPKGMPRLLMEELRNDGRWLRPWRRALAEYNQL